MSRTAVTLTDNWQQIAAGPMSLKVKDGIGAQLALNDVDATDDTAMLLTASAATQVVQNEVKATWAKGAGIIVIVDEV